MAQSARSVCRHCGYVLAAHDEPDDEILACPGGRGYVTPDQFERRCVAAGGVEAEGVDTPTIVDAPPEQAGHPGFLKIIQEMKELHIRKAADYGRVNDPFANVRASADFGVPAWLGVAIRMNDKLHRIKSLVQNGSLKNESVEDSFLDLAAYSIIALVLYREEKGRQG